MSHINARVEGAPVAQAAPQTSAVRVAVAEPQAVRARRDPAFVYKMKAAAYDARAKKPNARTGGIGWVDPLD